MKALVPALAATSLLLTGGSVLLAGSPRESVATDLNRVDLLAQDYKALDDSALRLLKDTTRQESSKRSLTSPRARNTVGSDQAFANPYEEALAGLEARLANLRELHELKPRLVLAYSDVDRPSLLEILYSATYFQSVITAPESSLEQRAVAFCSLAFLPEANAYFDEEVRRIWRQDVALAGDGPELGYLSEVFGWVEPTSVELEFYERIITRSNVADARAAAVNVLEDQMDTDPEIHELFLWLHQNDPSHLVRRRIDDALRIRS